VYDRFPLVTGLHHLEAFSVNEKDDHHQTIEPSIETNDDRTISLTIESYRDWKSTLFVSAIPLCVSFLVYVCLSLWSCRRASRHDTNDSEDDYDLIEPLLPPEDAEVGEYSQNLPPPTAAHSAQQPLLPPEEDFSHQDLPPPTALHPVPPQQPSAPIEDVVVVVPPENVEVVSK